MNQKLIQHGLILVTTTALIWFGFSQIDYMSVFKVRQTTANLEEDLGDMLWRSIKKTEEVIYKDSVCDPVKEIFLKLADANGLDSDKIQLHVINKNEVNAFAMPGNHIVVYTGLIRDCKNPDQLAGVLGHEIAHLEKGHIMKKLAREIGLTVLVSASGGSESPRKILKSLTSSAYDRGLESEADETAVEYLRQANIDPRHMADFMFAMGTDAPSALYWISTHPHPKERAEEILDIVKKDKKDYKPSLSTEEWQSLKKALP
jgi:predicted Zn-dependent protease